MAQVPYSRVTTLKDITPDVNSSKFVIYWCIAFKRIKYNFALQRAVEWANKLSQPLVILEPLILDYPMSSIRFHKFMMDGMMEVSEAVSKTKPIIILLSKQNQSSPKDFLWRLQSRHP